MKVFGIGLPRTGTAELAESLTFLGYNVIHNPLDRTTVRQMARGHFRFRFLEEFDGAIGVIAPYFPQLDRLFPGSKFILTVREKDDWLKSAEKWLSRAVVTQTDDPRFFVRASIFGCVDFDRQRFSDVYDRHLQAVGSYFAGRSDLLTLDLLNERGWGQLCDFLECDVPVGPLLSMNGSEGHSGKSHAASDQRGVGRRSSASERGVLYLSTGDAEQNEMLKISRRFLAKVEQSLPVKIATDRPDDLLFAEERLSAASCHAWASRVATGASPRALVQCVESRPGFESRLYKTRLNKFSPFATTLFLDNDTIVRAPIDDIWSAVQETAIAAAVDIQEQVGMAIRSAVHFKQLSREEEQRTREMCRQDQIYFNTGVLLWKASDEADRFFACWQEEWEQFRQRDQFAFARAVARTNTRVTILPRKFNFPVLKELKEDEAAEGTILHFWMPPKRSIMLRSGFH